MVQACGGDTHDITELSLLQGLLVDLLKEKRFLIVLDELWSIEKAIRDLLEGPLRFASWDIEMCSELASIGEEIVKRCKGLPLAAKVVGDLIQCKPNGEKLLEVLHSDVLNNDDFMNEILPVIKLSYDHLPPHLRNYFAYCSLFPNGYIFDKEQLIRLWMAQGFLQHHERLQPEDVGRKYFDNLLGKYFF
ncbi:putative disease resistance protein At3g14460 [Setaria italica]|uniref:putative disease resistance protein At3g14460 n=1 Tax=Setaria italica TaxID=4555 RepID=UPI000BE5630F|nr:putative disease resistance protein At3g14460 [Setaria italica]XP_034592756.1 putative disease resistance protein At3g14460 [Setaria viridis]